MSDTTDHGAQRPKATPAAGAPPTATVEAGSASSDELLRLHGICKNFGGVRALDFVDFELDQGEVHVLFGENGAGKSTLINILAGAVHPDEGSITLNGRQVQLESVHDARNQGIAAVFQEFSLAPDLTVEQNIFLGAEPMAGLILDKGTARAKAKEIVERLGFDIPSRALVSSLSRAQQQMTEIAKAMLTNPKILILDEPTSSLTEREVNQLFELIALLQKEGVAIIYITHRVAEIQEVGDRVTVLRDGKYIDTVGAKSASQQQLVELMTGRPVGDFFPDITHQPGDVRLAVKDLTTRDHRVTDVSIEVRGGEIVGLAGLVGCGKSEIGRACFGIEPIEQGTIEFMGERLSRLSAGANLARGMCYVPPDRRTEGLMVDRPTRENVSLAALDLPTLSSLGVLHRAAERTITYKLAERMRVTPLAMEKDVNTYSGGNQQKILLAKCIARETKVFLLDEPTIGVDVRAKTEVYEFLKDLVKQGVAVVLISSELPEILNLTNRVYVIHNGAVRAHFEGDEITEENLLNAFFAEGVESSSVAAKRS